MSDSLYRTARVSVADVEQKIQRLATYRKTLKGQVDRHEYNVPEAALTVPFDETHLKEATKIKEKLGAVSHVVLIGIGGSSVGTEAVYRALRTKESPQLHVLDLLDSERLLETVHILLRVPLTEIAIVVISKSGTTTETLANADAFLSVAYAQHGEQIYKRVVCIGDPHTPLTLFAEGKGISYVPMPQTVGGRYSVFTAVGLVPLLLLGIDVHSFVVGAKDELKHALSDEEHHTLLNVGVLALHLEEGIHTHLLFAEHERLSGFAVWYEQLFAESLGKTETRTGESVRVGAAPIVLTPRELHATAQLYLSRFPHTFTTFFSGVSKAAQKLGLVGHIMTHVPHVLYEDIPPAIMSGVKIAYQNEELSYRTIDVGTLSSETLGATMAALILEVMYLAELFDINAFDQPHVELYKKETRKILNPS